MKKIIATTNINKSNRSLISTIPKPIVTMEQLTNSHSIRWSYEIINDEIKYYIEFTKEDKKTSNNVDLQRTKSENYKKYIKGSKKNGYYIVNEEKNISIGAFIDKSNAKSNVDILVNDNWSAESVEISKLNLEIDITSEGYPYVKNNNPYYALTKDQYDTLYKDTVEQTPFKYIPYNHLQKIIKESLSYEEPEDPTNTEKTKVVEEYQTGNKNFNVQIVKQSNNIRKIRVFNNERQKQATNPLGITNKSDEEIEKIISELVSDINENTNEDEIKVLVDKYRK